MLFLSAILAKDLLLMGTYGRAWLEYSLYEDNGWDYCEMLYR